MKDFYLLLWYRFPHLVRDVLDFLDGPQYWPLGLKSKIFTPAHDDAVDYHRDDMDYSGIWEDIHVRGRIVYVYQKFSAEGGCCCGCGKYSVVIQYERPDVDYYKQYTYPQTLPMYYANNRESMCCCGISGVFWGNADDVRDVTGCEMNICNKREIEFRMMISELEYDGHYEYIV